MSNANAIFTLNGVDFKMQCRTDEKMKDICLKYASKIGTDIHFLLFLYGGSILNYESKFKDQANPIDKMNKEMKILVYKNGNEEFKCPKCGEKIQLNYEKIDNIILSNENIKDSIKGTQLLIENMIKNSEEKEMNIQLKNINIILNKINEDIIKNNEKIKNLFEDCIIKNNISNSKIDPNLLSNNNIIFNNINANVINNDIENGFINQNIIYEGKKINNDNNLENKNIIKGVLDIKMKKNSSNIILFKTNSKIEIKVYLNNKIVKMLNNKDIWEIDYTFKKDGKYNFKIVFVEPIDNMEGFFEDCSNIIFLDLSHFDSSNVYNMKSMFNRCSKLEYLDLSNLNISNVINMGFMFNECVKLKEIKGINHFNTQKVTKMDAMFQECYELEKLDLSNFDTSNVTNMEYMFNKCKKLKEIKGINNFITNKVEDMDSMFNSCSELEQLNLSNFNTTNVIDMTRMFHNCNSLKYLNLLNFTINCETEDMLTFQQKNNCNFITNNLNLKNIYNS